MTLTVPQWEPPSQMARDLGVKFSDDLNALITRSAALMFFDLDPVQVASILLNCLAMAGTDIETEVGAPQGSFVEMVRDAGKWRSRQGGEP